MEQTIKKLQKANELMGQLYQIKAELVDPIEQVAPGVFEFRSTLSDFSLTEKHTGRQFDIHHKCWFGDAEIRAFIETIADIMRDQDFPVPARDLEQLFKNYDCNQPERDLLLSKASSDEAYDNWAEEERRMMLD